MGDENCVEEEYVRPQYATNDDSYNSFESTDSADSLFPYPRTEYESESKHLRFLPLVYEQRYQAVYNILSDAKWNNEIKKVIDFGAAELGFFTLLKAIPGITDILEIDVDPVILDKYSDRAKPILHDYLFAKEGDPLRVRVICGSIAETHPCLLKTDAVVCIELIEHVYPDVLDKIPHTVFGYIRPKIAIFTTPNVEFNVLFPDPLKFRHLDHKFEWTREEFESWACNITLRYSEYTVHFEGIAPPPAGYENIGYVSQMAVFEKIPQSDQNRSEQAHDDQEETLVQFDRKSLQDIKEVCDTTADGYKLIDDIRYPIKVDNRTVSEKVMDEILYFVYKLRNPDANFYNDYFRQDDSREGGGYLYIPLKELLPKVDTYITSIDELKAIITENMYKVNEADEMMIVAMDSESECAHSLGSISDDDGNCSLGSKDEETKWDWRKQPSSESDWE